MLNLEINLFFEEKASCYLKVAVLDTPCCGRSSSCKRSYGGHAYETIG